MSILKYSFRLLSFLIPTLLVTNYILNHYYSGQSSVLDTGWFTYLLTQSTSLPVANPLKGLLDDSYFTTHLSLFYYPLSLLYSLVETFISPQLYFALFMGSLYGMIALAVFLAGEQFVSDKWTLMILFIMATLTPLNGVALGTIGFPHIEIAIPALLLLSVALYFRGNRYGSYFVVIALLMIREDAGFHLFGLFITLIVFYYFISKELKSLPKDLLYMALFSLLFSIVVIAIQKIFFAGDNALERIYLGQPHFAHLSFDFIQDRVEFFFYNRSYLYLPMFLLIPLAFWNRNPFLVVPLISTLPWLLLSSIAVITMPHSLSNYYAFPFITLLAWPIFAFLINSSLTNSRPAKVSKIFITIASTTLLSTALFIGTVGHVDNTPWRDFGWEYLKKKESIQSAIREVIDHKELFGETLYDEAMSSFMVERLGKDEYGYLNDYFQPQKDKAKSIIFFASSLSDIEPLFKEKSFPYTYRVVKSDILIASEYRLEEYSDAFVRIPLPQSH